MIRTPRTILLATVATATLVLAAACGSSDEESLTSQVFAAPPWNGEETYSYQLSQKGDDDAGTCTMTTQPEFEPGKTRLSLICENPPYRDERVSIVESETLKPITAERTVTGKDGKVTRFLNTYQGTEVLFEAFGEDERKDTTRELPEPTEEAPEPGYYDDDSLMWLVRGIPLEEGFDGTYAHVINAGAPRVLEVGIKVEGKERISVGDRQVDAWKIRVHKEKSNYRFWVDPEAPHRVLSASIEDTQFELKEPSLLAR